MPDEITSAEEVLHPTLKIDMILPRQTVGVVDDDSSVLRALSRLLVSAGYDVRSFPSSQDCLDQIDSTRTACWILDVHMPHMTGFELAVKLKQAVTDVPIVFISAFDSVDSRQKAASFQAPFLIKPISSKSLLERVAILADSHRTD